MPADFAHFVRIAKRIGQAAGYLELDMPPQALERLEGLEPLGPFEAEVALIRGEALRRQRRYADAMRAFRTAARKFPQPQDKSAWLALSLCYQQAGNAAKAADMLGHARGAH